MNWTVEQILALAPDAKSAKAGSQLAMPQKWEGLGQNEQAVWGKCRGSGKKPYQTQIDLRELAFKCSCPSRKFPCKHALALFLLCIQHPEKFNESSPPSWVTDWLKARARRAKQRTQKAQQTSQVSDPEAQTRRAATREEKIKAGLEELHLWLSDLAREGLAATREKPRQFWTNPAARLVDAQAPGLANRLQRMADLAYADRNWHEKLVEQLGSLYLLLEGYQRLETLPGPTQIDIRSLVGWTQNQEILLAQSGVKDHWLVLGQKVEEENRLRLQRTWLWGQSTQRYALILHFAASTQPLDSSLVPGTAFEAELAFYPGNFPLRALIKTRTSPTTMLTSMPRHDPIDEFLSVYATALAHNPWLEQFPAALKAIPIHQNEHWLACDETNRVIPLSPHFEQGWQLLAVSGGQPIAIFGEWDGYHLLPLSIFANQRFVAGFEPEPF